MTLVSAPDRRTLERQQLGSLNHLLKQLVASNRFYGLKLIDAGIALGVTKLQDFTQRMPFTTKNQISEDQTRNPPFGTNLTYPLDYYTRYSQTSASTGPPIRWLDTAEGWASLIDNWEVVHRAAGVHALDRLFFAFSFGPFLGFWTAFEAAARIGCLCIPGGGMSSIARLQAILDCHVTILCCTPTYALHLAEVAIREGIDLSRSKVRKIIVAGEAGGSIPATREAIQKAWAGARVFDHHGMTEVGPVSYESPHHPCVLHVIEKSYLTEVVHPQTGCPVSEGETGELVLTTLLRTGSPLLRYRTGDLVQPDWNGENRYGRPDVALQGGILGRVDDMVIIRGVNVSPTAVEGILRASPEVTEYQVEIRTQQGMKDLLVKVEPRPGMVDLESIRTRLEKEFQLTFNLRISVEMVAPGTLPRFEMKARRWIRQEA